MNPRRSPSPQTLRPRNTAPLLDAGLAAGAATATAHPFAHVATLLVLIAAVAALYFGRDVLIPVALAALLGFALAPLARRLRRWGLGRVVSVVLVVSLALVSFGGLGYVVVRQVIGLAENLPSYQANILSKIHVLQSTSQADGVLKRASESLKEIGSEIAPDEDVVPAPQAGRAARSVRTPVHVRVDPAEATPLEVIQRVALPVLEPIGVAGLVIVFLVFILLEQEDMRDRIIRLVGGRDLDLTTQALGEAADRVSRYLLMQLMVNATYGIPIGVGLYLIGVPNALLWGMLAVVLRFVPYVGPFIAALFPVALAIAVDPGWSMLAWTLALFVVIELISNNVIEPWLYGTSTGLSTLAIILAAIFWTTLWGPAGLLLSTPLTVCLVVLGRYVPQLRFLYVLLGSAPALQPPERFYQRMLAGDTEEGEEIAAPYLAANDLAGFHSEVAMPALLLAESDRRRDALTRERAADIGVHVQQVIADMAPAVDDTAITASTEGVEPVVWGTGAVRCVGARSPLDEAAAALLVQRLGHVGIDAQLLSSASLVRDRMEAAGLEGVEAIVMCYLGTTAVASSRKTVRALRRGYGGRIVVCLLNQQLPSPVLDDQVAELGADAVAVSLDEATQWLGAQARTSLGADMATPPPHAAEASRLVALHRLELLDTPAEDVYDRITRDVQQAFQAPIALISLVDEKRQFWKSSVGLPEALATARESPRETSLCAHVVANDEMMVVPDVLRDPRFANNPLLREQGIRFYAGTPLRTPDGLPLGALCVMDVQPRQISHTERALLQIAAQQVMREIAHREAPAPVGAEGT